MRNFDANTTAQLAAETAAIFWFVDIALDSATYRYSDVDVPLVSGGNRYEPNGFQVEEIRLTADMSVDRAQIEFQNVDLVMSSLVLTETIVNRALTLQMGCLNSSNAIIALETMFSAKITAWGGMSVKKCPLTLGNMFTFWHKQSLRIHQATCPWAFKSTSHTECGYSGAATACNKTWERCSVLGNTINFGGMRWLPALINKRIYWGVSPGDKL